jgi:predicted transcriptional regulator
MKTQNKPVKKLTSMRLTPQAKELITHLAGKMGITQSAVLEIAIRTLAKKENRLSG